MKSIAISKTTLNGLLAFFIACVPLAQTYPGLHISPAVMSWLSFAAGAGRLWVGIAQKDADQLTLPEVAAQTQVAASKPPEVPKP
jgi:hypothetical protein